VQCGPTTLTRKPFIRSMKVISRVGQSTTPMWVAHDAAPFSYPIGMESGGR
jgi:hypothetical protein